MHRATTSRCRDELTRFASQSPSRRWSCSARPILDSSYELLQVFRVRRSGHHYQPSVRAVAKGSVVHDSDERGVELVTKAVGVLLAVTLRSMYSANP